MLYYNCYSKSKHRDHLIKEPNCIKKGERKEPLEQRIIDEINKINMQFVEEYHSNDAEIVKTETLNKELQHIEKQITNLLKLYSLDNMPIEMINQEVTQLQSNRNDLITHIKELENSKRDNTNEIKETISQLAHFDWDNQETADMKRLIVAKLINKIIVSNDNINIEWAF